jgi:MFS family permease
MRTLAGFAALGLFWGAWGALVPAVQTGARAREDELGVALLMVGLGALFSMRVTGALIDRHGGRVLPIVAGVFGAAGPLPALAGSPAALAGALLVIGITSGALDVAINAAGVEAEIASGRPLLNLAHACFSATVVVASLVAGSLRAAGATPTLILGLVALTIVALALGALRRRPGASIERLVPGARRARRQGMPAPVLLALGALCAVAFVVENAWQTWSAVQLERTLGAAPGVSAAALAGLGTSVCAPTLISMAGGWAGPERRASAIATVTTVAYFGFLVGPALVGLIAARTALRSALLVVAVLALIVAAFAPLTARVVPQRPRSPESEDGPATPPPAAAS